ncbi:MAG TPA: Bax inhibitor-1/YccA family protein [Pseudonocardia sp.]|nr:Bax inhibitor-1/YccA family protein [Pseudonocardia sp.]
MRTSSNPAFRNLPTGQGGYAGFERMGGAAGGAAAYRQGSAPSGFGHAPAGERALTIDDVVTKTAITAGAALVAGVLTALAGQAFAWVVLPAFLVGLVISLFIIFKQSTNPALVMTYSVAEGIALGGITGIFNKIYPGIAAQAVIGTAGVFIGMLVVYKTGAVRVTPKLTKWIMGAMIGVVVLMLANFVAGLFTPGGFGLRDGGPIAIIFSLVVIGVAAFSLLLDFDQADKAIRAGVPAQYAWYIAFGLMTTLVWLYIEILRLLSYLRQD